MVSFAERWARRPAEWAERDYLPGVMIGVAVVVSAAVIVLLAVVLWLSFVDGSPGDKVLKYTLDHYAEIFLDPFTYQVILNTLAFSGITLAVALAIALPMAWLIERTDFPGKPVGFT